MVNKFVPFCPCCQSYHTDDRHQNHCFLGHAEKRIAELELALRQVINLYAVPYYYEGEQREKMVRDMMDKAIQVTNKAKGKRFPMTDEEAFWVESKQSVMRGE